MLLVKAPSETKLQTNSTLTLLHLEQSMEWKSLENLARFSFLRSGELLSPSLHRACRAEKESNSQQAAFTHSSLRPAIPSAGCTFTGAEFAHRAERRCWRRTSSTQPIWFGNLLVRAASTFSPFASAFVVTARNPEELFSPPQSSLNLLPPTSSAQLVAEVNHAITSAG